MLVSGILSMLVLPVYFFSGSLPSANDLFVLIGTAAISGLLNVIINAPISYLLKNWNSLKAVVPSKAVLPSISVKTRNILIAASVIILALSLVGSGVLAATIISKTISATGNITAVGQLAVYNDANGQTALTTINWGNIAPSSSVTTSIYIKNAANYQMMLSFEASGYQPASMAQYSTTVWSYNSQILYPGAILKIDVTFTAASDAPAGSFSYNIIIIGTQSTG